MIDQYLRYGIANPMPEVKEIQPIDVGFSEMRDKLSALVSNSMVDVNPSDAIFQLSGGFDSSVIVSYYGHVDTFCTGEEDSFDRPYANRVAKDFNTNHTWISHQHILSKIDFKEAIVEMASINRHPRCFKNDFGLYAFLNYINDFKSVVVSGKGIEFQLLGYHTIYNHILENALVRGDYSVKKASQYLLQQTVDSPRDVKELDIYKMIQASRDRKPYKLDMVNWWTGTFPKELVERLTGVLQNDLVFTDPKVITDFIFDWFGREYVDNRLEDYGKHFGVECVTPYINEDLVAFIKTIPIEAKKCLNFHKFIFYEAMAHRVPLYVARRDKEGLNTSHRYFELHLDVIDELKKEYLYDKAAKIYDHIDFNELCAGFGCILPEQWWSLLNLSIWLEHNASN